MASAAASFFPTATELSGGIRWLKKNPVVATAAAALSVIGILATVEVCVEEEAPEEATSPKQIKKTNLQQVVSWTDEHGGTLTQIIQQPEKQMPKRLTRSTATLHKHLHQDDTFEHQHQHQHQSTAAAAPKTHESASPQWGWYVAITPPRDNYSPATNTTTQ